MPRYKLIVSYDGTRFHGFQRQLNNSDASSHHTNITSSINNPRCPKRPHWLASGQKKPCHQTVQNIIEDAIVSWTQSSVENIHLLFASRTDKGVHSKGQVIAVTLPEEYPFFQIVNSINSRLPIDVSITNASKCDDFFDPRTNVKVKEYSYTIKYRRKVYGPNNEDPLPVCLVGPNSFRCALDSPCLWLVPWALDDSAIESLCAFLQGHHDYSAFVHKDDRKARSHLLTVDHFRFDTLHVSNEEAPHVTGRFVVQAKGFRRSMIRNLVGFCIDVCRGCVSFANWDMDDIWNAPETSAARIRSAPASGLCLEYVQFLDDRNKML